MKIERGCGHRLEPFSVEIPRAVTACTDALLMGPRTWFPRLSKKSVGTVRADFAGFPIHKRVLVELGVPTRTMTWTVIPLQWKATFPSRLFPKMVGRIEIAPVDRDTTRLTVSGKYQPPLGRFGQRADRAFMSHLADSTIRKLAESIASRIETALASHSEPDGKQRST